MGENAREHVILFPLMAQGHITPFLALASELEKRGFLVTVVSTPLNIKNLVSSIPTNSSSFQFREIPFKSSDHGLPPNTENTDGLPHDIILRLLEAFISFKPSFKHLVGSIIEESGSKPLCIITDYFFGWTAEIAHEFKLCNFIFIGGSAFGVAEYYSLWTSIPSWKVEGAQEFDNEDFPEGGKIHVSQLSAAMAAANGSDSWSVFMKKTLLEWKKSDGILFNTVEDMLEVVRIWAVMLRCAVRSS